MIRRMGGDPAPGIISKTSDSLIRQIKAGAIARFGVKVAAGGGNGGVAESGLDEVDGRAAVQSVTGMGVAHPVGRGFLFEAGAFPGRVHDSPDLRDVEVPALPAPKDRIGSRRSAAQFHQHPPGASLQENGTGPAAFAEHRNLTAVFPALLTTLHGVAPLQAREFGDADAGGVKKPEDDLVAAVGGAVDQARDVAFGQNALGEAVAVGPELQGDCEFS